MSRSSVADRAALVVPGVTDLQPMSVGEAAELLRGLATGSRASLAVKVLHQPVSAQARRPTLRRLAELRNASSTAGLAPVVLQGITADGRPYLVRPWSPWPTLADELTRGPLQAREVAELAMPLARGLAALHAAGLAHGNVCPGNVLLLDGARPALADAGMTGLAELAGPAARPVDIAEEFAAPEVICGGRLRPASDVYAFGKILDATLGPRPLGGSGSDPGQLQGLVRRMLTPEPSGRPAAATVLEELQTLAGEPAHDAWWTAPPEAPPLLDKATDPAESYVLLRQAAAMPDDGQRPGGPPPDVPALPHLLGHRRIVCGILVAAGCVAAAAAATGLPISGGHPRAAVPRAPAGALRVPPPTAVSNAPPPLSSGSPTPASSSVASAATEPTPVVSSPRIAPARPRPRTAAAAPPAAAGNSTVPAPTGLAVAAGNGGLAVTWNGPATGSDASPIVSYNLTVRRLADGATETMTVPVVNPGSGIYQPVYGLPNNFAYMVSVTAVDQGGHSSAPVSAGPVVPRG